VVSLAGLACATILVTIGIAAPANAQVPVQAPVSGTISRTSAGGLQVGGFDKQVAAANGYTVVTLPDGSQTSVRAADAAAVQSGKQLPTGAIYRPAAKPGTVSPNDFDDQPGSCGDSFVYLFATGGAQAILGTGFIVNADWPSVWYINWRVNIHDNGGDSTQSGYSYSGGHAFSAPQRILHLTVGPASATVPWYSFVILNDGTLCYSLQPTAYEDIV
jgi:hypothetical protein